MAVGNGELDENSGRLGRMASKRGSVGKAEANKAPRPQESGQLMMLMMMEEGLAKHVPAACSGERGDGLLVTLTGMFRSFFTFRVQFSVRTLENSVHRKGVQVVRSTITVSRAV